MLTDDHRGDEAVPAGSIVRELAQDAQFKDVASLAFFSLFVVPDDLDVY